MNVHCLVQAVGDRLVGQGVVGNLPLADQILRASDLVWKYGGDQVLGLHAEELRGRLFPASESWQRKRDSGNPAPTRGEHRRVEHRLNQHLSNALGMKIPRDLIEFETVRGGQR